ncbi:MAG: helix-hairpin-helix domain-containing protein [Gammaproteobacteria bacterium]|nr:helix-hairpin-helix domain-containing protein [Gammaproteobacteria bacterium]
MKIKSTLVALVTLFFSSIALATPVNINTATASEIAAALNGVGMAKAEALIAYRSENGMFTSAGQIVNVSGIGQATFEKNKADILVE